MSTTHTISNNPGITPYTVLGRKPTVDTSHSQKNLGLILLNRGARYLRNDTFERLQKYGWTEIISIESCRPSYDLEELSQRYPGLRFLVFQDQPKSIGEQINIAMRESLSTHAMVLWSYIQPLPMSSRFIQEIWESRAVCTAPVIRNTRGEVLPTICIPASFNNHMKPVYLTPSGENTCSLYPFDYLGIYNKKEFQALGGFALDIPNPYWQKMDFGLRSFLWGNAISLHQGFRVQAEEDFQPEDTTPDDDYLTFYLRNIAVEFDKDHGHVPLHAFWEFYRNSGSGIIQAVKQFQKARAWVKHHSFRFTGEARRLVELWEEEGFNGF
ncbi:hypothetical protein [Spirochaeta lutea]|uniref:Glycosyltransferase 2-like domain-containing protein n=1 Tax=Spirochaeta lutea TaxID=1480694 RepID=A0A098R1A4_9SPIO|nr:hypothetical protein [Spirochaeta lutea]KGE73759.1 hypothetical protein DC28_00575 [Spirochaeta lutea]